MAGTWQAEYLFDIDLSTRNDKLFGFSSTPFGITMGLGMISSEMRQPPDDFGAYLRRLRKERGWTADALSLKIGKTRSYVGNWERGIVTAVNMHVLQQLADILQLGAAERQELFRLAGERQGLDQRQFGDSPPSLLNVEQALYEVRNQIGLPAPGDLCDCVACASTLLAIHALNSKSLPWPVSWIDWPDDLVRESIVQRREDGPLSKIPIYSPKHRWPYESNQMPPLDRRVAQAAGRWMASTYMRIVLCTLDNCRVLARALQRWELQASPESGAVVSFIFKDVENQILNINKVSISVAQTATRRELISLLWRSTNTRKPQDPYREYTHSKEIQDSIVPEGLLAAIRLRNGKRTAVGAEIQAIHDSLQLLVRPGPWCQLGDEMRTLLDLLWTVLKEEEDPKWHRLQDIAQRDPSAASRELVWYAREVMESAVLKIEQDTRRKLRESDTPVRRRRKN